MIVVVTKLSLLNTANMISYFLPKLTNNLNTVIMLFKDFLN